MAGGCWGCSERERVECEFSNVTSEKDGSVVVQGFRRAVCQLIRDLSSRVPWELACVGLGELGSLSEASFRSGAVGSYSV